jgi:hypothetical protein
MAKLIQKLIIKQRGPGVRPVRAVEIATRVGTNAKGSLTAAFASALG